MKKTLLVSVVTLLFAAALAGVLLHAAASPQIPLANTAIPQFAHPLPLLTVAGGSIATVDGSSPLTVRMCEFDARVLPPGTFAPGVQPRTRVWGYIAGEACPANGPDAPPLDTGLGPVVLATRGVATTMTFVNELGNTSTTGVLAYKYSTDQTLHWADPLNGGMNACSHMVDSMGMPPAFGSPCAENYAGPIPAVVHLHGGEVPPELDGGPNAWFTSDGAYKGNGYYSSFPANANEAVYRYPNRQEASPIWFHDHTLGVTRLNVYAGLAGAYLIKDDDLSLPAGLHPYGLKYTTTDAGTLDVPTVPLIIQDRSFDTNGQLFFQADSNGGVLWAPNPEHPYWAPELVGDTILVNGKVWPYFNVEPKRYRFLFLNGSNARTYEMFLVDPVTKVMGPAMYVIATDGGYLDAPVRIDPNAPKGQLQRLLMMPGERYEVILDFSGAAPGSQLILRNVAKTPFPAGTTPNGSTTGRIMQFRVGPCTSGACGPSDTSYNPAPGTPIRTGSQVRVRLVDPFTGKIAPGVNVAKTRQLTLNEIMGMPRTVVDPVTGVTVTYPGGPLQILVNNTKWSGESSRPYGDFTAVTLGGATTYHSELPTEGTTELWEIVNLTADAHPIHLHLVQFQILNRQVFNTNKYPAAYAAAFPGSTGCAAGTFCPGFGPPKDYRAAQNPLSGGKDGGNPDVAPYLQGPPRPPAPNEAGWKDTVIAYPGEVTRIAVRWAPTSLPVTAPASTLHFPFDPESDSGFAYVWHCHIIDHEDNEMMRPDAVRRNSQAPEPADRLLKKGIDY